LYEKNIKILLSNYFGVVKSLVLSFLRRILLSFVAVDAAKDKSVFILSRFNQSSLGGSPALKFSGQ
jgi:hypothetical protein